MKEIDKKVRNIFLISLGFNAIALSVFFLLFYYSGRVGNSEMEKSIISLREMEEMQSSFSVYSRAIGDTQRERAILDGFIINKKTAAVLIGTLEDIAEHAGVVITKTVSVEKNTTQPKENMLRFSIRAKGSMSDVFYFMTLLENLPYKLRFKSFAMGMGEDEAKSSLLTTSSIDKNKSIAKNPVWAGETTFEVLSYINE